MKNFLFASLLILNVALLNAQDQTTLKGRDSLNHLTFLGIPIDGNIDQFISKMQEKGLTINKLTEKGSYVMNMKSFAGRDVEMIVIVPTIKTKKVWKVAVIFNEESSWYSLKNTYITLRDQLKEKYGKPDHDYSFFANPYNEGDGYEMSAISNEKCDFLSDWKNGIGIEITKQHQVMISYEDPINIELQRKETKEISKDQL